MTQGEIIPGAIIWEQFSLGVIVLEPFLISGMLIPFNMLFLDFSKHDN